MQNGRSIESEDGWQYSIETNILKTVSHVYLMATKVAGPDGSVNITDKKTILHLKGGYPYIEINKRIDKVCSTLQSLLEAIERGDPFWNAADHDLKKKEEATSVEGTVIKPSGSKAKEEMTAVEGTTVKPSKC